MKRLLIDVTVGNFNFDYVTNARVESSFDLFTDTASIVLPNKFRIKQSGKTIVAGTTNLFERGDVVTIKAGYFPKLPTIFEGHISKILPDSPLVLECEDDMWLLKQVNLVSKEFADPTIKDVVEYATASQTGLKIEYDDENAKIGAFHVDNSAR